MDQVHAPNSNRAVIVVFGVIPAALLSLVLYAHGDGDRSIGGLLPVILSLFGCLGMIASVTSARHWPPKVVVLLLACQILAVASLLWLGPRLVGEAALLYPVLAMPLSISSFTAALYQLLSIARRTYGPDNDHAGAA